MSQEETKTIDYRKDFTLSEHWSTVESAHRAVSFDPDIRANSIIKDYSLELDQDLKDLGENQGKYKEKYIRYFLDWIGAKSRCMSWMITGPANFPTSRVEKANRSEHNKYEAFRHWRNKYFTAVNRERHKSPEEDLEIKMRELDELVIVNEKIKECNKIIRKYKKGKLTLDEYKEALKADPYVQYWQETRNNTQLYDALISSPAKERGGTIGTYATKIREMKDMATALKVRIERKKNWKDIPFHNGVDSGRIALEDDRIKIYHDAKPSPERLKTMSEAGFKYSPRWNAHCRKHTGNAVWAAKRIVGVPL